MSDRTCSIEGCDRLVMARGWCSPHYTRYLRHGDPLKGRAVVPRQVEMLSCSVEGCDRAARTKGRCQKHYYALRSEQCSIDGCTGRLKAKGFCNVHYRHADIGGVCEHCGAAFIGDRRKRFCSLDCKAAFGLALPVEYAGAHRRVKVERGSASLHRCVDCGAQARDWSYTNTDPNALMNVDGPAAGLPYSLDSAHYEPRCKPCHKKFDQRSSATPMRGERQHHCKLTEAEVREIRAQYAAGGITFQRLANQYGVSKKQVLNIVHRRSWGWLT